MTQHTPEPLIKTIDGNAYVKYGDYHALQQQRDELLAALKYAYEYMPISVDIRRRVYQAIVKAGGEA